ncbi:phenylalanine-4-hydroxylase-like isoform X2 [Dysidea avara]|uniref:phenylalanine-4-hydroxylase-like isoform X2 n=1 Tax=Dysidea avara TaxID=196820 RepID=UPI00331D77C2
METELVHTSDNDISIIFSLVDKKGALLEALQQFQIADMNLTHIESRPSNNNPGKEYDFYTSCSGCSQEKIDNLLELLKPLVTSVSVEQNNTTKDEVIWFPHTIYDLDEFATQVIDYGEDLGSDHPGVKDPVYCKRRKEIANIAFNYKQGQPIPTVEYTTEEIQTWRLIFQGLTKLHPTNACQQYNQSFLQLVKNCGFCEDSIPQLETVSKYLKKCSGFQLRPAAGLWTSRDFLSALAFRVFPCTQYIRHSSKPFYTPEPDVCHEMIGHVPLLADPTFASFSQEIGLASLGAPDDYIKKLATFYWFTMEFGVCNENGERKAYGAGLLGSVEEIQISQLCCHLNLKKLCYKTIPCWNCNHCTFLLTVLQVLKRN